MNEEKIERLLQSKNWSELTEDEKALVSQMIGGEEMFASMKKVDTALAALPKYEIRASHKIQSALQQSMRKKHASNSFFAEIFAFRVPAYASAIIAVILSAGIWLLLPAKEKNTITYVTKTERDTVFVTSKPDTILVTKVLYLARQEKKEIQSIEKQEAPTVAASVTMKEKEYLDNLLVSGSR
jgi:hypothetical protein